MLVLDHQNTCISKLLQEYVPIVYTRTAILAVCHSKVIVTVPASVTSWTCTPAQRLELLSSKLQGKRFLDLTPVCDPGNQGMGWPACKVWHQIMCI